jgi:hypothetical protein
MTSHGLRVASLDAVAALRARSGRAAAAARARVSALPRRIRAVRWRQLVTIAGLVASLVLVVSGITDIYAPAGKIAGGIGLLALLMFDLAKVGRLTWPR